MRIAIATVESNTCFNFQRCSKSAYYAPLSELCAVEYARMARSTAGQWSY